MRILPIVLLAVFPSIPAIASAKPKLLKLVSRKPGIPITRWLPDFQLEYSYGPNDSLSRFLFLTWDSLRGGWDTTTRDDYSWSADDRESIQVAHRLDTSRSLIPLTRIARRCDAMGRLLEITHSDPRNADWVPRLRQAWVYDAAGKRSTTTSLSWDPAVQTFTPFSRDTLSYDPQGREIESLDQYYSAPERRWMDHQKETSTYDSRGLKVLRHLYKWKADSSAWFLEVKDTLCYDASHQKVGTYSHRWPKGPNWRDSRDSLVYDLHGNVVLHQGWFLDPATSEWYGAGGTRYQEITYAPWGEMIAYERWEHSFGWYPIAKVELHFEGAVGVERPARGTGAGGAAINPGYRYDLMGRRRGGRALFPGGGIGE